MVSVRAFYAKDIGKQFKWDSLEVHWVTLVEIAPALAANEKGFRFGYADPATGRIDDVELAAERVALAAEAAHRSSEPLVLTGRAENHIRGVDDLDDTVSRLIAYRGAGADVVYAPGLADIDQIAAVVEAVGVPVNVLLLPNGPTIAELAAVGVRRVSTGGALAGCAYGALAEAANELLAAGTSTYAARRVPRELLEDAFGRE
jgi:2-methylisocitrate lyase-like PEP mutase family enzyme